MTESLWYLQPPARGDNTSDYPLQDMARSLSAYGVLPGPATPRASVEKLGRALAKTRALRSLGWGRRQLIYGMMGPAEGRLFPAALGYRLVPIIFDCWPRDYRRWESILRRHRVKLAFFTCRYSAGHFLQALPEMSSHWLPEACDPDDYDPTFPLPDRKIRVLELGRRYDRWHEAVAPELALRGQRHLYQDAPGKIIFADREQMRAGLQSTAVSVCFPSSLTHPARSGAAETVTHRYFESMATGCLIVGTAPAELLDLFGYNPVVEIDWSEPAGQIVDILSRLDAFSELTARNRATLATAGSWDNRVERLLTVVAGRRDDAP